MSLNKMGFGTTLRLLNCDAAPIQEYDPQVGWVLAVMVIQRTER